MVEEAKKLIKDSRVIPTTNLSNIIANLDSPPQALLCGSAVGFYGNRGTRGIRRKFRIWR